MIPLGAVTAMLEAAPSAAATGLPAAAGTAAASGLGGLAQGASTALPAGAAPLSMNGATTGLQNVGNFFKGIDRTLGQWGDALDPQTQMLKAMGVENPVGKLPGFMRFLKAGQPQVSSGGSSFSMGQQNNSFDPLMVGALFRSINKGKGMNSGGGSADGEKAKATVTTKTTEAAPTSGAFNSGSTPLVGPRIANLPQLNFSWSDPASPANVFGRFFSGGGQ